MKGSSRWKNSQASSYSLYSIPMRLSKSVSYTSPRGSFRKRAVAEVTQDEPNRLAQPSSNYRAVHVATYCVASRNCNGLSFRPQAVTQGRTAAQEPRTHQASVHVLNCVSRCLPTTPFDTHQLLVRQRTHLRCLHRTSPCAASKRRPWQAFSKFARCLWWSFDSYPGIALLASCAEQS